MDYNIFYKDAFGDASALATTHRWDIFLSAYNSTDRVREVFEVIDASLKWWIVHSEYRFELGQLPSGEYVYVSDDESEDTFMAGILDGLPALESSSLCIDISGFMRPHLMVLLWLLAERGVREFDAIYTEPLRYAQQEATEFAQGDVSVVRTVDGYGGFYSPSLRHDEDLLIIGVGYEHDLIRQVAREKQTAQKVQLLAFPPLQADFYQESRLNLERVADVVSAINVNRPIFAPAHDPFVTAQVLHETVEWYRQRWAKNIYLCPLASRPQALGFALYYLFEGRQQAVSIIYPFTPRYSQSAARGIARIWKYRIELP